MAAEHQAAGGILVEPVCERGRAWQPEPQRVEMVLEAQAALGAAMHREACGLVDYQHQSVAVEHARQHFVGVKPIAHGVFHHHLQTAITTTSAPFPKFVIHGGTLGHELRKQRGTSKYMISHDPAKWTPVPRKDHAPPIVSARPDAKPEATFAGRARAAPRFEVPS